MTILWLKTTFLAECAVPVLFIVINGNQTQIKGGTDYANGNTFLHMYIRVKKSSIDWNDDNLY